MLTNAGSIKPVEGNSGGAFLTIASSGALIFGIINIVGSRFHLRLRQHWDYLLLPQAYRFLHKR